MQINYMNSFSGTLEHKEFMKYKSYLFHIQYSFMFISMDLATFVQKRLGIRWS